MSNIETPPREAYKIQFPFRCEKHPDQKAGWTIYDMIYKGTPICEECGEDMTLVPPLGVSESEGG